MEGDMDELAKCPQCGGEMTRGGNRVFNVPMIRGDTCSGCQDFSNYYDESLGEYVTGRAHREELMKKKGLCEYAPDPEMKKHRDEARYIRKNAKPDDAVAAAAAKKEYNTAADKRRNKLVNESLNKSFKKADAL
jgi:hypothetical protein